MKKFIPAMTYEYTMKFTITLSGDSQSLILSS